MIDERVELLERLLGVTSSRGSSPYRLPPRQRPNFSSPSSAPVHAGHRVASRGRRQLTPKWFCSRSNITSFSFGRHAHRADALHVRVPANRHQARARPADHAAQQREIADRLDVLHAVNVMRDSHRPTEDDVLRLRVPLGDLVDLRSRHAALGDDLVPRDAQPAARAARRQPLQWFSRNGTSCAFVSTICLADAGEQGQVAADMRLHVEAGDLRAEQHAPHVARHAEVDQPRLDDRVDDDHLAAAPRTIISVRISRG